MDDLISRQATVKAIEQHKTAVLEGHKWDEGIEYGYAAAHRHLVDIIEQLPAVQPEPCEDAVSREAVLSMIDTYMNKSVELHYLPTSDGIKKLISILPIVTPKLRKETNDLISRQQAIDALRGYLVEKRCPDDGTLTCRLIENEVINKLPSIQPEIIRCKDCKYYKYGICMKIGANKSFYGFCDWAERGEQNE